jgi:hypothetical protein
VCVCVCVYVCVCMCVCVPGFAVCFDDSRMPLGPIDRVLLADDVCHIATVGIARRIVCEGEACYLCAVCRAVCRVCTVCRVLCAVCAIDRANEYRYIYRYEKHQDGPHCRVVKWV